MNSVNVDFIAEFNGQKQKFKFTSDAELHRVEKVLQNFAQASENDVLTVIDKEDNSIVDIKLSTINNLTSLNLPNRMKRYILILNKKPSKNIIYMSIL